MNILSNSSQIKNAESLKEGELNQFIILYALKDYALRFKTGNNLPQFSLQLEQLIERYDRKCTNILVKRNLVSGVVDAVK